MATDYQHYELRNRMGYADQVTSGGKVGIKLGKEDEYMDKLEDYVIELENKVGDNKQ